MQKIANPRLSAHAEALRSLAMVVSKMHGRFCDHVARQERPTGFLTVLTNAAPRYVSMVDHLHLEHASLAAEMAALRSRIVTASPDEFDQLARVAASLAAAVAEHEALEREMLADAFDSGIAA